MTRVAVAVVLLAVAAGSAPGRGEEARPGQIRVEPSVQIAGDHVLVSVQGRTGLPDGARVRLALLPAAAPGQAVSPLQTAYAEVKAGAFTASPWNVKRADIRASLYRVEASVASDQPPELRRPLQKARGWIGTADLILESWRERCRRITPQAQLLLDRLSAMTRHRDDLLAVARLAHDQKLSSSDWKAWSTRGAFMQARARCAEAFTDPASVSLLSQSCEKGLYVVSTFDGIVGAIQQTLPGSEGRENPEFKSILSVSLQEIPPDYLVEFQRVLVREGAFQFAGMLREAVAELDPGTPAKPRTPAPERLAVAQRDVRLVLDQVGLFFGLAWPEGLVASRAPLIEAIEQATRLLDESKPSGDADAFGRRSVLWNELRTRLERLIVSLR